jgi:hypothetical protein
MVKIWLILVSDVAGIDLRDNRYTCVAPMTYAMVSGRLGTAPVVDSSQFTPQPQNRAL